MKIYGESDSEYEALYDKARGLPNVFYHGIVPNDELQKSLRTIDFLTYPSTFEETACLAVIEAMAAGCRVIVPAFGALPETTAGYAHLYPWSSNEEEHLRNFTCALQSELQDPWRGRPELVSRQQEYCRDMYSWDIRSREWEEAIGIWTRGSSASQ
jgi:glycosyltransferase involved in cell wall biosynthesis